MLCLCSPLSHEVLLSLDLFLVVLSANAVAYRRCPAEDSVLVSLLGRTRVLPLCALSPLSPPP